MQEILVIAFVLAAVLNAATAVIAWRYRNRTPAAAALAAAAAGLTWWSLVSAPQNVRLPAVLHEVLVYASFPGILGAVVGLHLLARFVVDPHHRPGRRQRVHLVAVPAVLLALVATDPWHHLVFSAITPLQGPPWFDDEFGPVFWVHTAWCYLLLAGAYVRLGRAWRSGSSLMRTQSGTLLLAGLVPLLGNVVVLTGAQWFSGQDLTPLFFTLTAALDAWAVLRGGLLRMAPVARAVVLETVQDHVVVVDTDGTVVDVNPAGRAYLQARRPDLPTDPVGVRAAEFLSPRALGDLPEGHDSYVLEFAPGMHLDVRVTLITDRRGFPVGRVVVGRDITDLITARRRLEEQVEIVEGLRARLAEEAARDPLTGLHNRRHFEPAAAALLAANSGGVGVLVLDIDHFKRVNDTHGHAAGDTVLVAVADALRSTTRRGDLLARTGGEEFALLVPGTDAGTLRERAEELRAACSLHVDLGRGAVVTPTVSVGVTLAVDAARPLAELLAEADDALYAAKAGGRDRVSFGRTAAV